MFYKIISIIIIISIDLLSTGYETKVCMTQMHYKTKSLQ